MEGFLMRQGRGQEAAPFRAECDRAGARSTPAEAAHDAGAGICAGQSPAGHRVSFVPFRGPFPVRGGMRPS
jgi:hypothetical protein